MKLNATVSRVDSAHGYDDKQQRIFLKVAQAESDMYNEIKLPNTEGLLALDDELVVLVLTKEQAVGIFNDLETLFTEAAATQPLVMDAINLRDQLRPDPPPPWERTLATGPESDEATTQEFVRP